MSFLIFLVRSTPGRDVPFSGEVITFFRTLKSSLSSLEEAFSSQLTSPAKTLHSPIWCCKMFHVIGWPCVFAVSISLGTICQVTIRLFGSNVSHIFFYQIASCCQPSEVRDVCIEPKNYCSPTTYNQA